jgi:hypothetical protein
MAGPADPRQSGAHDYHIHVFHTGEYIKPQTIWLKFCAFCAFLWQSTHMLCARQAELVYREDLKEFRNNGWSLFGLAQSLRAQGKSSAARKAEQDFERAWKNADVTLKASVF